jgi:hypothetical protein
MKNLITILFLALSFTLSAQAVRTTVTSDGTNVTIQTPVNSKVIPVCDFHWIVTDGILKIWIEGGNEIIPGGRLGNFTISGATTQAAKLAALGAISDECSLGGGSGGADTLYLPDGTALVNGDTVNAIFPDNTLPNSYLNESGWFNTATNKGMQNSNGTSSGYFTVEQDRISTIVTKDTFSNDYYYKNIRAGSEQYEISNANGNDFATEFTNTLPGTAEKFISLVDYVNSRELQFDMKLGGNPKSRLTVSKTAGYFNEIFVDTLGVGIKTSITPTAIYYFPDAQPSNTNLAKSVMTWTGNGSTATPAFEAYTGSGVSGTGLTNRLAYWTASGAIGYENTARLDTVNNYLGIGSTAAPNSRLDVTTDNLGVTQTNTSGIVLSNNTAATVGAQQMSPGIRWRGNGWKTDATAASQTVDFLADVLPVQGTANPTGTWQLKSSINGGAYNTRMSVTSGGVLSMTSYGSFGGIIIGNGTDMLYNNSASVGVLKYIGANNFGVLNASLIVSNVSSGASADRTLHTELSDATTNTTTYPVRISKITSGTATTNFGVGIEFEKEGADGANDVTARINAVATDATAGTEDDKLTIDLVRAGTLTEAVSVSSTGTLTAAENIISSGIVRTRSYTVATLPAGTQGDMAWVTDATAPTYLGALTGGGAVVCPVFFNGSAWVSH